MINCYIIPKSSRTRMCCSSPIIRVVIDLITHRFIRKWPSFGLMMPKSYNNSPIIHCPKLTWGMSHWIMGDLSLFLLRSDRDSPKYAKPIRVTVINDLYPVIMTLLNGFNTTSIEFENKSKFDYDGESWLSRE